MTKEEQEKIEERAVCMFGGTAQRLKAIEEMAELTKELLKYDFEDNAEKRKEIENNIAEEMADVEIMLEQLEIIFKNRLKIDEWKDYKLERTDKKIQEIIKKRNIKIEEEKKRRKLCD